MKNIVIADEYNEIDFKPSDLLQEYLRNAEKDVSVFLIKDKDLKECSCPGCQSVKIESSFKKFGLQYRECADCRTLYVSPRPSEVCLDYYYKDSPARIFWRKKLSRMTGKKRKEKIIKPRFQWILESTMEYLPEAKHIVDINTDQYGYIEELMATGSFQKKTLINPFLMPEKQSAGLEIINTPLQKIALKGEIDVISVFEVGDRTADVESFFGKISDMLRNGGLCFVTAILISGFDLQTLWAKAENLYPPDRLNVFSVEGLKSLFIRHGFECLEFSTPGILDVAIVNKAFQQDTSVKLPRFVEYMLKNKNEQIKRNFQEFLQSSLLSSYGRVLLRKK